MPRRGEPVLPKSLAGAVLSAGNKGGAHNAKSIKRVKQAKAANAQVAFLTAMVARLQEELEQAYKLPVEQRGRLGRTSEAFAKPMSTSTLRGVEGEQAAIAQGGSANTESMSSSNDANLDSPAVSSHSTTDVSRETTTGTPPASVPSALDGYEKRLEAMGLRVPVPVVPDEIWQFLEGAETIEDGHLRLQKYQAAMRAFGRYYTQIGEVDRGFQVVLMLTNQMKDMYMARSKSAGGYLVRESELAALEAEISGMSDEELAQADEKDETDKDS